MALVREGDVEAIAYLNELPPFVMRTKVHAGATPWRPRLVLKGSILAKYSEDQARDPDGRFATGDVRVITDRPAPARTPAAPISFASVRADPAGARRAISAASEPSARWPTGSGGPPRPGMGDTVVSNKQLEAMRASPVTGQYVRPDGTFTPERQALHDEIVRQAVAGASVSESPKMVMVGGGSASGKSNSLDQGLIATPSAAVHVDSDELAKALPETQAMMAAGDKNWASATHEEGSYLAQRVTAAAQEHRADIVLDGGRATRMNEKIDDAHRQGYAVEGHIITRDPAGAQRDAAERGERTGQVTPPDVITQRYAELSQTLPGLANKFDTLTVHENTGTDAHPVLHTIATGGADGFKVTDQGAYDRFLSYGKVTKAWSKKRRRLAKGFAARGDTARLNKYPLRLLKYSEDQPRVPSGEPGGGRFAGGEAASALKPQGGGLSAWVPAHQAAIGSFHPAAPGPEPHPAIEAHRAAIGASMAQMTPTSSAAQVAAAMRADAEAARPGATAALRDTVAKTPGASILGDNPPAHDGYPGHSLKDEAGIEKKIGEKQAEGERLTGIRPTPLEASSQMFDALRYTAQGSKADYTEAVKGVAQGLVNKGYTFERDRVKNTWDDYEKKGYRGLNTTLKDPQGRVFELQFHTPESFYTKDTLQHPLYKEWQSVGTSQERKDELHGQMMVMADALGSSPPGVGELTPDFFASLRPQG